jgi:hypothetical protein
MSSAARIALFIGGAHKAGTTALYQALVQHPELAGHAQPELAFFVEDEGFRQGFDSRAWRRYLPRAPGTRRFVAKHVKLFYRRAALERLRAFSPEAHLVLLLRHPVERAYSAYWHARAHGREELASFEAALAAEDARVRAGRAPWHDTCYVRNGAYAQPLRDAFEVFGRERVHVHLLEDVHARALELVRGFYALLGVDAGFRPDLERGANRARAARSSRLARLMGSVFDSRAPAKRALRACVPDRVALVLRQELARWNSRALTVPPMADETRATLAARFRTSNEQVQALLGRDLSHWGA